MSRMWIALLLVCAVALMLPPLFTHGACTAEFDAVSDAMQHARSEFGTVPQVRTYLAEHSTAYQIVTPERCASWPPPEVVVCPGGPIFVMSVPVNNKVCRYYRDGTIRVQLGFNKSQQLIRMQVDMKPFKYLKLPFGVEMDWAK